MAGFVNTIDILGDDAVTDGIISRSITEYKDNNVTSVGSFAFYGCTLLETVDLPAITVIGYSAFSGCSKLTTLVLRNAESAVSISSAGGTAFTGTPFVSGNGHIYVPSSLLDNYKSKWGSKLTSRFRALEDYTVDGTITGELDPSKI